MYKIAVKQKSFTAIFVNMGSSKSKAFEMCAEDIVEKDFRTVLLFDIYSGLLTEKQYRLCDMYYNQDYSLSEIAEIEHSTRQAARDGINKARQKLLCFESTLNICEKKTKTELALAKARTLEERTAAVDEMIDEIEQIWESSNGI
jgi:uncharacterized protein